jgi:CRP-like cAMP-binding protein
LLRNGKRHILNVILPGDIIGIPNSFYERAAYPVSAVDSLKASFCRLDDYLQLCYQRPQFAFALCWLALQEATTHAERVIGLSRRTPVERLSHFLLELHARLSNIGLAKRETFAFPFSQEIIADVLGLSTPHLNRVIQQLKSDKLVVIRNRQVEILDREIIKSLAHYNPPELSPIGQRSPHLFNKLNWQSK